MAMAALREACGVFGVYDFKHGPVLPYVYWGLISQNHRGQQSHGLLTHESNFHIHKALGLVPRMKSRKMRKWLARLPGYAGIGNVRYTTSGRFNESSLYRNVQPTIAEIGNCRLAISFNGNIVNVTELRREVTESFNLEATSDAELLCKKLCLDFQKSGDLSKAVERCMRDVEGAYSITGLTGDGVLFTFRDPLGVKPLCMGFSEDKMVVAISSESVGLAINDLANFQDEVDPGELLIIGESGIKREQLIKGKKAFCAFEFAYFARPDSMLNGTNRYVYEIRKDFGGNLGRTCIQREDVNKPDMVIPVPETANDAGYGFHEAAGIPLEPTLRRHRYVTDRAFITIPGERGEILDKKVNVLSNKISGKKIALVDDSIVRGDTTKSVLQRIRAAGAKEIHLYITFPKIISPCFYGIDMATFSELIGAKRTPSEIASIIGADSVIYQRLEDFVKAIGIDETELCLACLTGTYPTPLAQKIADEKRVDYENGAKENKRVYE